MKILFITSRFPFPIEKGDKLRVFHQIKSLSKNHEIALIAISDIDVSPESIAEVEKYCSSIHLFKMATYQIYASVIMGITRGLPFQVSYFYNASFRRKIHGVVFSENPDHIYCQLIRVAEYIRSMPYLKSIDFMDNFSLSTTRRANKSRGLMKLFLKWEARRVAKYEQSVFFDFNHHFIISEFDKNAFNFYSKKLMHVIPNGIDREGFKPLGGVEKTVDIVFVGNMGYYPNIQAAQFLLSQVLPHLTEDTHVLIAGARPSPSLLRFASSQVTISGWIEDIREAYQQGRIFVAPIFEGAGLQNKVLEAMALGIPCIITSTVNNGLQAIPEKHVLLADNVSEFVAQIQRLLADQDLQRFLIENAKQFVVNQYDWEVFNAQIDQVIESEYDAFNRKRSSIDAQYH